MINDLLDGYYIQHALNNSNFFEKGILDQIDYLFEENANKLKIDCLYVPCIGDCILSDYAENNAFENPIEAHMFAVHAKGKVDALRIESNQAIFYMKSLIRDHKIKNHKEYGKEGY